MRYFFKENAILIMYDIVLFSDNSGKWCQGIPEHFNHHKTEMRLIRC